MDFDTFLTTTWLAYWTGFLLVIRTRILCVLYNDDLACLLDCLASDWDSDFVCATYKRRLGLPLNKMTTLKRKRDPTFVSSEKMALINLVQKYFDIVESKKTDAVSTKNKNIQWQKMAEEFNSSSPIHPRDWTVLKNCWENLKKKAKSEQTAHNQHHIGTGGGPPRKQNTDPAIERVLELIHTRVSGFVNIYDSDGTQILASGSKTMQSQTSEESANDATTSVLMTPDIDAGISESVMQDTNTESSEATDIAGTVTFDWSQYTPNMLRGPISSALRVSRSMSPEVNESRVEPQHQQASTTPPRAHTSTEARSRRRPTLRSNTQNESLNAERINTLLKTNAHAEEEHAIQIKILQLQEQREQEILKQEKLKTAQEEIKLEILKIQLQKMQD